VTEEIEDPVGNMTVLKIPAHLYFNSKTIPKSCRKFCAYEFLVLLEGLEGGMCHRSLEA
jgi:hypothetical protein